MKSNLLNCVSAPVYTSQKQHVLGCFQNPFDQKLLKDKRIVTL
jgi:hypothetical protein